MSLFGVSLWCHSLVSHYGVTLKCPSLVSLYSVSLWCHTLGSLLSVALSTRAPVGANKNIPALVPCLAELCLVPISAQCVLSVRGEPSVPMLANTFSNNVSLCLIVFVFLYKKTLFQYCAIFVFKLYMNAFT